MFLEVLLAIVIVVVICLIFYILIMKPYRSRNRIQRLLEISNGTFDEPAQQALHDLDAQTDLTPAQHAIRGNIIRYNLLENPRQIPRARTERRQFGRMVRDYEQAVRGIGQRLRVGGMGGNNIGGDNIRTDNRGGIIDGAFGDALWNPRRGNANMGGVGMGGIENPEFILHNAMTLNDLFGPMAQDPLEEDFDILQMMLLLNGAINENAPIVQRNTIETRVANATANAENRAEVVANALRPQYTDDRQNVHDTKINSDLNEILRKIATPVNSQAEIADARRYINAEFDGIKRIRANEALSAMEAGGTMSTYGDTEDHIFALVWKRCKDPRNADNREIMHEAVANALADCYDGTPLSLVCANGRCSRIINSLATIDYDPTMTGAMTFEAYKNTIMQEAGEIFDNAIENAKEEGGDMQRVALAYTDPNVDSPPEAEREFKNRLRDSVDNMLNGYRDKFTLQELERIRQECYVYVTL
jgi:hypothetical protein